MRTKFTTILTAAFGLFTSGCAHRAEFALTARLLPTPLHSDSPRLVVDLRNASIQGQRIMMLTDLFEGYVYLRDTQGEVRQFMHTNYWVMCISGFWIPPTVELAPGASLHFDAPLSEFMCPDQLQVSITNSSSSFWFPTLATQVGSGCELWYALDVHRPLDDPRFRSATTLVTASIRHSRTVPPNKSLQATAVCAADCSCDSDPACLSLRR